MYTVELESAALSPKTLEEFSFYFLRVVKPAPEETEETHHCTYPPKAPPSQRYLTPLASTQRSPPSTSDVLWEPAARDYR
jgi:hypothetical protein